MSTMPPIDATQRETLTRFIERLFKQNEFSIKLGLDPMRAALAACQHPERRFPSVLAAGTNGKGSVTSSLAAIAQASGARVGLFTSPHLLRFAERLRVDGRPIEERALLELGPAVLKAFGGPGAWPDPAPLPEITAALTPRTPLTYFELATLMAAIHFARVRCSLAVMEVGLGGRLDATNAFEPTVSLITAIGLDHQQYLGDDLPSIAREKAGIMRAGVPVVLATRAALEPLLAVAAEVGAPPLCLERDFDIVEDSAGVRFEGLGRSLELPEARPLVRHQRDNLAAAIAASLLLDRHGILDLDEATIRQGVRSTRWPGRLWLLPPELREAARRCLGVESLPTILLDAAHNTLGAQALVKFLQRRYAQSPLGVILGAMTDKDIEGIGDAMRDLNAELIVTTSIDSPRAASAQEVRDRLGLPNAEAGPTLEAALKHACDHLGGSGCLVIAGSIYLLGELLSLLGCSHAALTTFEDT